MRRRNFSALLGGAALTPLFAGPVRASPSEACGIPVARDDGWLSASNDQIDLINRASLCKMTDRIEASPDINIHSVVVARRGKLVFERYFRGDEELPGRFFGHRVENITFDADTSNAMKSVSKSIASLVVGIAIDRGFIHGTDTSIFDFFPELSDLRTTEKDRILLVHALTMSTGLKWEEATPDTGDFANDEARMNMAWDPCRYVLGCPVTTPAGQQFFGSSNLR